MYVGWKTIVDKTVVIDEDGLLGVGGEPRGDTGRVLGHPVHPTLHVLFGLLQGELGTAQCFVREKELHRVELPLSGKR